MGLLPIINFEEKFEEGYGCITIIGLDNLPVDFLPKLWSKFKKHHVRKKYEVDGAATFTAKQKVILCRIFCNAAYTDSHKIPMDIYTQRFQDTFPYWANDFESLLESIATDSDFFRREKEDDDQYTDRLLKISNNYMPFINKKRTAEIYEATKQDAKLA